MVFDDPNLVSAAGLVPVMRLGEAAGLHELLDEHLSVASPNPVVKSASVIAGMLAGADSIDDLDVLRHGGMRRCFAGVRAPSTLGSYLRSFRHGHVQQLDAVASRLLAGLAARVPGLLAGGTRSASSTSTTRSVRFTAMRSRLRRSATRGCGGSTRSSPWCRLRWPRR